MDNVMLTSPAPSMWRRAGLAGVAAVAALAVGPIALTFMAPVTVAAQQQSLDGCDFITSGGFVVGSTGKKANFGAHGGCKNGDFWGELNFVDHANGYHVQSVQITGYGMNAGGNPNARDVCGVARTSDPNDPETVNFVVRLIDNGEPGSGDVFGMKLSNGYNVPLLSLGAARPGGNVQLHKANASTVEYPLVTYGTCAFTFDDSNS